MIRAISGTFYHIHYTRDLPRLLHGAHSPEGRFHHDGEAAFYMSPSPQTAAIAVASYVRPDDPLRVTVTLLVAARVVDLREPETLAALGLQGHEASVLWRPERAAGIRATSWLASDAGRLAGADGMVYTSRSAPDRWHLVLFCWNRPGRATVTQVGPPVPFLP
ncbi:MAG: RES family NAD+ phosphorylase [bacterium]